MAELYTAWDDYPTVTETSNNSWKDSMSQTNDSTLYYPQGSSRDRIIQDDYPTVTETSNNSWKDSTNDSTLYYPQGSSRDRIIQDVTRLLCSVSKKRKMKMAFKYHLLSALLMGTVASVGTLVGGPSGGVMGVLLCGWMVHKKLKSVPQIIMELPADKQKRLFNEATAIIRSQIGTNIKQLTRTDIEQLVMNSETLQEQLVDMLKNYFKKELDLEVK